MFNQKIHQAIRQIFFIGILFLALSFSARAEMVDAVVAVVNNEIITLSELVRVARVSFATTDPSQFRAVLEKLIDQKLIDQATRDMPIKVSEKEIDTMIQSVKENNKINDEQLKNAIQQQGVTWEEYRKEIYNGLRRNQAINQKIRSETNVTDQEIKDYYEKNPSDFFAPAQVKLEKLYFLLPDPATPEKEKAVSQRAEEALSKIKSGMEFQSVAKALNLPEKDALYDIGTYKKGELTSAIDKEAFTLNPGDLSKIINTGKGYCIIRVLERFEDKTKKLEEVRGSIANFLYQKKIEGKIQEWLQTLRSDAYIDIKFN